MLHLQKFTVGAVLAALFIVFAAPQAGADLSKADEREVNSYQLTEKKLAQFGQATRNLVALAQKDIKIWQKPPVVDAEEGAGLTKLAKEFDKIPGVKKAVEDAGMTSREYWVFHLAMIYGATGHIVLKSGGKLPEGYSKANTDFFAKHEEAFKTVDKDLKILQELSQQAEAEEDDDEEDDVEDEDEEEDDDDDKLAVLLK